MNFKKLETKDKEYLEKYFLTDRRKGCEYSFACNFIWQDVFNSTFSVIENCYVAKTVRNGKNIYNLPLGEKEDIIKAIKVIIDIEGEGLRISFKKDGIGTKLISKKFKGLTIIK